MKFVDYIKNKKRNLFLFMTSLVMTTCMVGASSCQLFPGGKPDDSSSSSTSTEDEVKTYYTITFDVDGGSEIASAVVLNGGKVARPAAVPTKPGYVFVGWYTNKTYTVPFAFENTEITEDTTIYARYVAVSEDAAEYTINYVVDGVAFQTTSTVNGTIYQMPVPMKANAQFVGWWASDYNDADKLTAKVEDGTGVNANVTLYAVWASDAPNVSVTDTEIKWTAKGVNNQYSVKIFNGKGTLVASTTTSQSTYAFDFADIDEGHYTVEVTLNGNTTTAYYKNRALTAVEGFTFTDSVLVWNEVPNASSYIVSVECGDSNHSHINVTVKTTAYDFTNCAMKPTGIKFKVKAVANNYLDSETAEYVVIKNLDAVTGVAYNNNNATVTWDAVENATGYTVTVNGTEYKTTKNTFDVKAYTGNVTVKVVPEAFGYNAPAAVEYQFTKAMLPVPTGVKLTGSTLTWNAVDGATGYVVKVNDQEYTVTDTSFNVLTADIPANAKECNVSIKAVGATDDATSVYSDAVTVGFGVMSDSLVYSEGKVTWQPVINVTKYEVQVNDGDIVSVNANTEEAAVVFTKKGTNVIKVRCYNQDNQASEWVQTEVVAYAVSFDFGPSYEEANTVYVADGDTFALPTVEEIAGYDFGGWFNAPTNGVKYENATVKFNGDADQVVYANWTAKTYTITYKYKNTPNGDWIVDTKEVTYGQEYTIPTIVFTTSGRMFCGWYSQENGQGNQYTDEKGNGIGLWNGTTDITVFASIAEAFEYTLITTAGNQSAYSVKAGAEISKFSEIKIPAMYNGKPVAWIDANAFANCANIKKISIPDSIERIELGLDGAYKGTGSAFYNCSGIEEVDVYDASSEIEDNYQIYFTSIDGALVRLLADNGKELAFVPAAKTGEYRIPEGVTALAIHLFKSYTSFNKIIVPATVVRLEDGVFEGCKAKEIVFEDGEGAEPLSLGTNTFRWTDIESFNIPARMTDFGGTPKEFFYQNDTLKTVTVSEGNPSYSAKDGLLYDAAGETLIYCPRGFVGELVIPNGTKTIASMAVGDYRDSTGTALDACEAITKVVIPASVTEIEKYAFEKCVALFSVEFKGEAGDELINIRTKAFEHTALVGLELPENTGIVEAYAFGSIKNLTTVTIKAGEGMDMKTNAFKGPNDSSFYVTTLKLGKKVPVFDVNGAFGPTKLTTLQFIEGENDNMHLEDGVLFNKAITSILYYPATKMDTEYTIPATIQSIGSNVFNGKAIVKIVIPFAVTEIGEGAFSSCSRLTEVVFATPADENAEHPGLKIGNNAFASSSALKTIVLPDYTKTIGASAFKGTKISGKFIIPEGVTSIGDQAFANCTALTEVQLPASLSGLAIGSTGSGTSAADRLQIFEGCTSLKTITFSEDNPYYRTVNGILYGLTEGVATDLIYCPANYTIEGNELVIPNTVRKIYSYAFANNRSIKKVRFEEIVVAEGEGIPTITLQKNVFESATALEEAYLGKGVARIESYLFNKCTSLKYVFIPNTVNYIVSTNPFGGCTALEEIEFEEGNETNTLSIMGGNSYAYTGSAAFGGFKSLKEMTLPARMTRVDYYLFYGSTSLETINIPATVKIIDTGAFTGCTNLKNVNIEQGNGDVPLTIGGSAFINTPIEEITLPERTTAINGSAFKNTLISTIHIPKSVTTIGANAFQYCNNLTSITFEEGSTLKSLGNYAFASSALKEFNAPASLETIGQYAFAYALDFDAINFAEEGSKLTKIDSYAFRQTLIEELILPESSGNITLGSYLFQYCAKLKEVYLSKSVVSAVTTFAGCGSLRTVEVDPENVNFKADGMVVYNNEGKTAIQFIYSPVETEEGVYRIVDGVVEIGAGAFFGQEAIKTLYIPASVVSIGANAFQGCINLEKVIFENSNLSQFNSIGNYAFDGCFSLKEIKLPTSTTTIGQYAFRNCEALTTIEMKGVTKVDHYAFRNCTSLEEVEFGSGLKTLGTYAFRDSGLKKVTIPATLTFGTNVTSNSTSYFVGIFSNCANLKEVTIEEGLTTMGYGMFQNCTSLEEINVPETVTKFGSYVFAGSGLKNFVFNNTNPTINTYMFTGCKELRSVTLPSAATLLPAYMFDGCSSLGIDAPETESGIVIPETVTDVRNYVFRNCTSLKRVELPNGITFLGAAKTWSNTADSSLFMGCTALQSVKLPDTITNIGASAFRGCTSLKTIENLDKVTRLGNSVFRESGLSVVFLPNATTLGNYLFTDCTELTTVVLNPTVTKIDNATFMNCKSLEVFTIPAAVNTLGTMVFAGSGLKAIEIPASISTITAQTFQDCANLEEVTYLGTIIEIAASAFENCEKLEQFVMPRNLLYIRDSAFKGTNLKSVTLPATVSSIGDGAFADCPNLTNFTIDEGNPYYAVVDNAIVNGSGKYVYALPNYTVTNGKLVITDETNISSASGYAPFAGNNTIKEVEVTAKWTSVPSEFFYGMKALEKVTLPATVTSIGSYAFADVPTLKTVIAPGVVSIGSYAFSGCTALTTFEYSDNLSSIATYAFAQCGLSEINIPATVRTISDYAFYQAAGLKKVTLNEGLTKIGLYAFSQSGITEITIPASVTQYGGNVSFTEPGTNSASSRILSYAFADCADLKKVVFLSETFTPTGYTFMNCTSLAEVVLPSAMTEIENYMFYGCSSLENITIPETVTKIGGYAFAYAGLKEIEIPENVTIIGNKVALTDSTVADTNNPYITGATQKNPIMINPNGYTFAGCANLEKVTIKGAATYIGFHVFDGCSSLEEINIPDTVELIGDYAFANCTSLKELKLSSALLFVGIGAFENAKITNLVIPVSVVIFDNAFSGWTSDQTISAENSAYKAATIWSSAWYTGSNATIVWNYVED